MIQITILTPTIGSEHLHRSVNSVAKQIVPADVKLRHLLVIDGQDYSVATHQALKACERKYYQLISVADNTGKNKWNGHRIYAHYSQLIDCDYLALLDEDNSIDYNHIASLIPLAEQHGFAFSKRKIYDQHGNFICNDNFESIGKPLPDGYTLVDTSCWMLRRDHVEYLYNFDWQWLGDRVFTNQLAKAKWDLTVGCSNEYTMNYFAPDNLLNFYKDKACAS